LQTLTRTGFRLGTPRYMAPEMARGQPSGEAGDLYALGLVLAEMLVGTPIIGGNAQIEVLMLHASEEPLVMPRVVLDSPWGTIVQRAVAKPLDVRYRSAMQMHADVAAVLERLEQGAPSPHAIEDELSATLALADDAPLPPLSLPSQVGAPRMVVAPTVAQPPNMAFAPPAPLPSAPAALAPLRSTPAHHAQPVRASRTRRRKQTVGLVVVALIFVVLMIAAGLLGYLLGG
jgi:serine/threonine protein kinase